MINLNTKEDKDLTQLVTDIVQLGILDAVGDGVSILDTDFTVIYQNEVHRKLVGDHVGAYCYTAYGSIGHTCENCPMTSSFRFGGVFTSVKSAFLNGRELHFEITASPIKDKDGEVIAGIEVVRDITERRRSEATLIESEKKYHSLVETSPDMIFITERDTGKIMDLNESVCRLLGYSREELIGTLSVDCVVSSQRDSYIRMFKRLINAGKYVGEFEFKKVDGSTITVEVRGGAFDDYVFTIVRDITQRHIYEEEIKKRVEELEDFYEMAIGREIKMMDLKKEIANLKEELEKFGN